MARRLPVFPLGTVLMPYALLPLHVFEERYRVLMNDLLEPGNDTFGPPAAPAGPVEPAAGDPEMGVVLIERGHEVGGGEVRSGLGTVAKVLQARRLPDGRFAVLAGGTSRFRVSSWLPDAPYPLAEVEMLCEEEWDPGFDVVLRTAEKEVRRALALSSELGESAAPPSLSTDGVVASWQLCASLPVGPFDRQRLLSTEGIEHRLGLVTELAAEASSVLAFRLGRG